MIRINWTHARKSEFCELWNKATPALTAGVFGIDRAHASVVANRLREEGYPCVRRETNARASLSRAQARAMNALLLELAAKYKTTPAKVVGFRRKQDGRMDARRALAWVAYNRLSLSLRQIGLFFGIYPNHTIPLYWESTATDAHKQAGTEALEAITSAIAQPALEGAAA